MFSSNKNLRETIGYDFEFEEIVKHYDAGPPIQACYYLGKDYKLYSSIIKKEYLKGERTFRPYLEKIKNHSNFKSFLMDVQ